MNKSTTGKMGRPAYTLNGWIIIRGLRSPGVLLGMLGVLSSFAAAQRRWVVDPRPIFKVGGTADTGAVLQFPVGASVLADGRVMVADAGASAVHLYSAKGTLLQSFGRNGSGPGEFRRIAWLGQCASDSIMVWDMSLRRLSVIDHGSGTVQSRPFPQTAVPPPTTTFTCGRDGRIAYHSLPQRFGAAGSETPALRGTAPVILFNPSDGSLAQIANVPTGEMAELGRSGGGRGAGPSPLGKVTTLAIVRDRLFVATADSASISVYLLNGSPAGVLKVPAVQRVATDRAFNASVDAIAPTLPASRRAALIDELRAVSRPRHLPPYATIHGDDAGVLWVDLTMPGDSDTRLLAFAAGDSTPTEVRVPRRLKVFEVGLNHIVGYFESSGGEPGIAVFRLRRP